jgi:lipoprotein-anchoring transpeptidase ErfK/SrfK
MKLPTTLPTIAMTRTRWFAVAGVVAALGLGGVGLGVAASRDASSPRALPAPASTTTTSSTTSTTAAPTTTLVADPGGLHSGSTGADVQAVQQRLRDLHYDPGAVDGNFGLATTYAVQAFEKLNGMAPDGRVDVAFLAALASPAPVVPLVPGGGANRVEVDLKHQVLFVYLGDQLRLITHVSTGSNQRYCVEGSCQMAVTPIGAFRFSWRASGWREARLGKLYNPVYFTSDGVAVHGSQSVPTYPASHGCVRIPMHIAEYFPSLVKRGDPIYVTDGRPVGPPPVVSNGPPPTDTPTTPGDDSTTTSTTSTTSTTTPSTTTSTTPLTTTSVTTP